MVADTLGRGKRLFPEIRAQFASSQISLPLGVQLAATATLIAVAVACCFLVVDRIGRDRLLVFKEATRQELQEVLADRDKAIGARDRLRARIAELEEARPEREPPSRMPSAGPIRLAGLVTAELAQPADDAQPPLAAAAEASADRGRDSGSMAEMGRRAVGEFRRLLASTGLNIERLFPQLGPERAEGGPFVPPPKAAEMGEISKDKLEAMRSLIKSLPLAIPLDVYQLESRFGRRRDPFNRRPSFHTGLDLSASYMSPVYSTAAGIVTYAGYRSEYGKVVEIDHGNGISTLYAHLHRAIVSVGQRVAEHTQIGFLGSTGRSSGPHVHYEIIVNDEPQDPEKFIGLARVIPAAAR